MFIRSLADFNGTPWTVQVTVGAITVTAQATSSPDRHDKQGSGDFYLAISGDLQLATSGDFYMATDTTTRRFPRSSTPLKIIGGTSSRCDGHAAVESTTTQVARSSQSSEVFAVVNWNCFTSCRRQAPTGRHANPTLVGGSDDEAASTDRCGQERLPAEARPIGSTSMPPNRSFRPYGRG
jgi:hypothetical protein